MWSRGIFRRSVRVDRSSTLGAGRIRMSDQVGVDAAAHSRGASYVRGEPVAWTANKKTCRQNTVGKVAPPSFIHYVPYVRK